MAQVPGGKATLRINMGETSICLYQGASKGAIIARKRKATDEAVDDEAVDGEAMAAEPEQKVSKSLRRTYVTHVAFVCDRPDLQPLLPQVIIGNCHTFLVRDWGALLAGTPRNIYLVRQKSAWNNHELLPRLLGLVVAALGPHLHELHRENLVPTANLQT